MISQEEKDPPRWLCKPLLKLINADFREEIEGDLQEVYQIYYQSMGAHRANWRIFLDLISLWRWSLCRRGGSKRSLNQGVMIKTNLKLAYRTLLKNRTYSGINLAGLSVGLTIGGLIMLYVFQEYSVDRFHRHSDRIYKVFSESADGSAMETNAWPVGHVLATEFPEVESVIYARRAPRHFKLKYENQKYDHNIHYASADFLSIFSFEMLEGDPALALVDPYSVVLTKEIKEKYFADGPAVGQTLTFADSLLFEVKGVIDIPKSSHIQVDMLMSFSTFESLSEQFSYQSGWGNFNMRNYVMLKEGVDTDHFRHRAASIYNDKVGEELAEMGVEFEVGFIALNDVYLRSGMYNGMGPSGSESQVRLVLLIALFTLMLACINYINLSTARSVNRSKEVGIRKVTGSTRTALVIQFLTESALLTLFAGALAVGLMVLSLGWFSELMDRSFGVQHMLQIRFVLGLTGLGLLIALLAGYYPAWIISGYSPIEALRGQSRPAKGGLGIRKVLIVFQFFISTALLLAMLLVLSQLEFMRNQNLGFDKEQLLVIDGIDMPRSRSHEPLRSSFAQLANVQAVSFTNALPGRPGWQGQWAYVERISEDPVDTEYMAIDENYIHALGLELVAGKNFDLSQPSELEDGLLLNKSCVKAFGWASPTEAIGQKIVSPSDHPAGTVIGVVKDYHGLGLQEQIWPKAMDFGSNRHGRYFALRFETEATTSLLDHVRESWSAYNPDIPLQYFFLDEDFDRQYRSEDRLARVLTLFTMIVLIVSGIGLLGLMSFVVLNRTKEVGIRKTLGASVSDILYIFSREFIFLVIIANIVAIPLVLYFGSHWLENFAYRTTIQWWIFPLALVVTVLLACLAVGFQTLRTARMNPVQALNHE